MSERVTACCYADTWPSEIRGPFCTECGKGTHTVGTVRLDYPAPARPTREDDRDFFETSEAAEQELNRPLTDEPGPCERIGRYLDGAWATVRDAMRLLVRRGL